MILLCSCVTPNQPSPTTWDVEWAVEVQLGNGFQTQNGRIEIYYDAGPLTDNHYIQKHGKYNLITDMQPNEVCFHGNHWSKRHIHRNTNTVHDRLVDGTRVYFEWTSTSNDKDAMITLDSVIFIAKQSKGDVPESGMEFMMKPYNSKAYCYEGYIKTRETVRLRDCTHERIPQIHYKINVLNLIQNNAKPVMHELFPSYLV